MNNNEFKDGEVFTLTNREDMGFGDLLSIFGIAKNKPAPDVGARDAVEMTGGRLNDACWEWVRVIREANGSYDGRCWNNLKPAIKAAIEHYLKSAPVAPPPPAAALTDADINDITMAKLGKWPSFEAQSWACKVVHVVSPPAAVAPVPGGPVVGNGATGGSNWSGLGGSGSSDGCWPPREGGGGGGRDGCWPPREGGGGGGRDGGGSGTRIVYAKYVIDEASVIDYLDKCYIVENGAIKTKDPWAQMAIACIKRDYLGFRIKGYQIVPVELSELQFSQMPDFVHRSVIKQIWETALRLGPALPPPNAKAGRYIKE